MLARIQTLRAMFSGNDGAAVAVARRWRRAFGDEPELAEDLIRHGGILLGQPVQVVNGASEPAPLDPYRLAYEAGKRDFAMQLLSLGGITYHEMNKLLETQNDL